MLALATLALASTAAADEPDGCAFTPGGWGAPPAGENPGALLEAHFDELFPDGLFVGPYYFETAEEVAIAVPVNGDPLLSHTIAITLNGAFGDSGYLEGTLTGVEVVGGPYDGLAAEEVYFIAIFALFDEDRETSDHSALVDALSGLNEGAFGCNEIVVDDTPPEECVDDVETEIDECAAQTPCEDDMTTDEDECAPTCEDDMTTDEDECSTGGGETPCEDDMATDEDECGTTEIPMFPGATMALAALGAIGVVGFALSRRQA